MSKILAFEFLQKRPGEMPFLLKSFWRKSPVNVLYLELDNTGIGHNLEDPFVKGKNLKTKVDSFCMESIITTSHIEHFV